VHFVEINNFMGGYQAGSHIAECGHKSVGYLASDVRIHNFEERQRGFLAALKVHGVESDAGPVFTVAPTILSSQEALKKQIQDYLQAGRKLPGAFFCECDYIAISAIKTLTELGFRIPEDISVVGFDNINESMIVTPELTTVHVEKERMAQIAVDLLVDSMEQDLPSRTKTKVDTMLIERLSCIPVT
jgi:DNA-binding LacI/PurR family transcriptional regulator